MAKPSWELYGLEHLKRELERRAAAQQAAQEQAEQGQPRERSIVWRRQAAQGLGRLPYELRLAIERAVEELRTAPDQGYGVKNACCDVQRIAVGGYYIFYIIHADYIEITGLRRP